MKKITLVLAFIPAFLLGYGQITTQAADAPVATDPGSKPLPAYQESFVQPNQLNGSPVGSEYGDNLPKGIQNKIDGNGEVPGKGLHKGWEQGHGYGRQHGADQIEETSDPAVKESAPDQSTNEEITNPEETTEQPASIPEQPVSVPEQPASVPEQPASVPEQPVSSPEQSDKGITIPSSGSSEQAANFYRNILGREPESQAAIDYWAGELTKTDAATVAARFFASDEFQKMSTAGKIAALYRLELGREPEAGGAEYWGKLYDSGTSLSEIAGRIAQSPEFKGKPQSFQDNVLNTLKVVEAAKNDKNPAAATPITTPTTPTTTPTTPTTTPATKPATTPATTTSSAPAPVATTSPEFQQGGPSAASQFSKVTSGNGYQLSRIFGAVPAKYRVVSSTYFSDVLQYFDGSGRYIGTCDSTRNEGTHYYDAYGQEINTVLAYDPVFGGMFAVAAKMPTIPTGPLSPLERASVTQYSEVSSGNGYSLSRIFGTVPTSYNLVSSTYSSSVLEYFDGSGRYIGKVYSSKEGTHYYDANGQEIKVVLEYDPVFGGMSGVAAH